MTRQLSFLDAMMPAPVGIIRPVDPNGPVTPLGNIQETLRLPHPKMVWDTASIELHPHENGEWMWATSVCTGSEGYSYQVGPKWGKFARSRSDALWLAADEIERRAMRFSSAGNHMSRIAAWCAQIKQEAQR